MKSKSPIGSDPPIGTGTLIEEKSNGWKPSGEAAKNGNDTLDGGNGDEPQPNALGAQWDPEPWGCGVRNGDQAGSPPNPADSLAKAAASSAEALLAGIAVPGEEYRRGMTGGKPYRRLLLKAPP